MKKFKQVKYILGDKPNYTDKESLIKYLKSHRAIGACPGTFNNPYTGESIKGNTIYSDNTYEWKDDLVYLVDKYDLIIYEEFLLHCKIK